MRTVRWCVGQTVGGLESLVPGYPYIQLANSDHPTLRPSDHPAMALPQTLYDLSRSPWGDPPLRGRSVREELRHNLVLALERGTPLFPGIVGYDDTVLPQLVNAILAQHDFILLGLRGQAKTRIIRGLVSLLDEQVPVIAGSEVNDDPFNPISKFGRDLVAECGDATPIAWRAREDRYVEKLATPDVTVADMIGDVDPIKAARGGHLLSDELTMHFGLLPRANRGIFAINELPDLSGKIQVGLFNIMQEGDVQLKGYPVRLPLDVLMCFTANPEDYTARGKIITPLKDRIGSEIVTHYPRTVELGMQITAQEAWVDRGVLPLDLPDFVAEVIERIAFEAREDKRVDRRSGVSQRLPISVLEHAVSSAERRALALKEPSAHSAGLLIRSVIAQHLAHELIPRLVGRDRFLEVPAPLGNLPMFFPAPFHQHDVEPHSHPPHIFRARKHLIHQARAFVRRGIGKESTSLGCRGNNARERE